MRSRNALVYDVILEMISWNRGMTQNRLAPRECPQKVHPNMLDWMIPMIPLSVCQKLCYQLYSHSIAPTYSLDRLQHRRNTQDATPTMSTTLGAHNMGLSTICTHDHHDYVSQTRWTRPKTCHPSGTIPTESGLSDNNIRKEIHTRQPELEN